MNGSIPLRNLSKKCARSETYLKNAPATEPIYKTRLQRNPSTRRARNETHL